MITGIVRATLAIILLLAGGCEVDKAQQQATLAEASANLQPADPALAELFTFWRDSEGTLLVDDFEGIGSHLFSDSRNAVQDVLGKYGYDLSKMVYPVTREDGDNATHWRKLAMDAFAGR